MSHASNHTDPETESMMAAHEVIFSFIANHTGSVINDTHSVRSHIVSLVWNYWEELHNGTLFGTVKSVDRILSYISNYKETFINDTQIEALKTSFEYILSFLSPTVHCILYNTVTDIIIYALSSLGIIANIVAFHVFGKMGHKNSSTLLLRALAVMDSLFLIFSILTVKTSARSHIVFSTKYFRPVLFALQISAVWTSILLGINRYIVVCHPLMASRWCTIGIARKQLAIVVFLSVICVFPQFFEIQSVHVAGSSKVSRDMKPWAKNYYYHVIYRQTLFMILVVIVPLLLQLLFSIRLGVALHAARRVRQEMGGGVNDGDKYVTRLVLGVLVVFIICYIPKAINNVSWMVHGESLVRCGFFLYYYQAISWIFVILNSSVNCVIYIVFNPNFRKTFQKFISCRIYLICSWNRKGCKYNDMRETAIIITIILSLLLLSLLLSSSSSSSSLPLLLL